MSAQIRDVGPQRQGAHAPLFARAPVISCNPRSRQFVRTGRSGRAVMLRFATPSTLVRLQPSPPSPLFRPPDQRGASANRIGTRTAEGGLTTLPNPWMDPPEYCPF